MQSSHIALSTIYDNEMYEKLKKAEKEVEDKKRSRNDYLEPNAETKAYWLELEASDRKCKLDISKFEPEIEAYAKFAELVENHDSPKSEYGKLLQKFACPTKAKYLSAGDRIYFLMINPTDVDVCEQFMRYKEYPLDIAQHFVKSVDCYIVTFDPYEKDPQERDRVQFVFETPANCPFDRIIMTEKKQYKYPIRPSPLLRFSLDGENFVFAEYLQHYPEKERVMFHEHMWSSYNKTENYERPRKFFRVNNNEGPNSEYYIPAGGPDVNLPVHTAENEDRSRRIQSSELLPRRFDPLAEDQANIKFKEVDELVRARTSALLNTMPGTAELSAQVKQDIVNLEMELQSCLPKPYKRPREE